MIKVLGIFVLALILTAVGVTHKRWEGQPPEITFDRDFKAMGRTPVLAVNLQDSGTGLKHVTIRLKQKDQDVVLADEALNKEKSKSYDVGALIKDKYKVQEGPASLSVNASDSSLRNFFK